MNELIWFCLGILAVPAVHILETFIRTTIAAVYDMTRIAQKLWQDSVGWHIIWLVPKGFFIMWMFNLHLDINGFRRVFKPSGEK